MIVLFYIYEELELLFYNNIFFVHKKMLILFCLYLIVKLRNYYSTVYSFSIFTRTFSQKVFKCKLVSFNILNY